MRLCVRILGILWLSSLWGFAESTRYVSVYTNPTAGRISFSGKKVAAFVIIPDEGMRQGREETLAEGLRQRGVLCFAGYTSVPDQLIKDHEKAREFLQKSGVAGAVLMRLVGDEERIQSAGAVWYGQPYYAGFSGYWNYGWSAVSAPSYVWKDRVITLETPIYSIESNELLWAGRSETTNPKDVRKFVQALIEATGKELRKAGLVSK